MKKRPWKGIALILSVFLAAGLSGQDLVYQPQNPAFGGSYLNYTWLLNSANAQNKIEDPDRTDPFGFEEESQLDQFTESLNRQLLNELSRRLFDDQFGEGGLREGTYLFGNYQIEVAPGLEGVTITIFDLTTGGQTQVTVPFH